MQSVEVSIMCGSAFLRILGSQVRDRGGDFGNTCMSLEIPILAASALKAEITSIQDWHTLPCLLLGIIAQMINVHPAALRRDLSRSLEVTKVTQ